MRKIVEEFLKSPSPKLRKQLTTEELRFVQRTQKNKPKQEPKANKPEPKK